MVNLTGSSGFIGLHLYNALMANGIYTTAINCRDSAWPLHLNRHARVYINLVGKAHDFSGSASFKDYEYANVTLTADIFNKFLESSADVFIHFSSIAAVCEDNVLGILTEDQMPTPVSFYGKTKLQAETYLLAQELPPEKRLIIIRPAMVYGPGDKGNLRMLYKIIARSIPYPLKAYGNKRSFIGIDNLCFAVLCLLRDNRKVEGVFNLVDDTPIGTSEIVDIIEEVLGKKVMGLAIPKVIIKLLAKAGDFFRFIPLNSDRLRKLTCNYVVSNAKIKHAFDIDHFPVDTRSGIKQAIHSFVQEAGR